MKKRIFVWALVACLIVTGLAGLAIPTSGATDTDGKFTSQELRLFGETGGVTLPIGEDVTIVLSDRFNGIDNENGTTYVPQGKIVFYYSKNTGKTNIAEVTKFPGIECEFGYITDEIAQKYGITKNYYGVWYEGTVDTRDFDIGDKIYIYDSYEKAGDDDRYSAVAGTLLKNRNFIMVANTSAEVSVTGNAVYGDDGQLSAIVTTDYEGTKYTKNQILTGKLEFFVNGESIGIVSTSDGTGTITVPKDKIPAIGDYPVKVKFIPGSTSVSAASEATDTLTVDPRPITLKPNNVNVRVDDTLPAIEVGVSDGSFGFDDTLATLGTITADYATGSSATVHTEDITITNQAAIIAANPNYAITFEKGTLKVAAANVPPTIENITKSDAPTNEPVEVTFTIGDDATPVDELIVNIIGENNLVIPTTTRNGSTITFMAPKNTTYTIKVTDSESAQTTETVVITCIDDEAPYISTVFNGTNGWINEGYDVEATIHDDVEVSKIVVTDPEGNESTYYPVQSGSSVDIDFPVIMNGNYSVVAYDSAGNDSNPYSFTIDNIDMVAPTIGTIAKDEEPTKEAVSVTIPVADNVELDKILIAKDGANPVNVSLGQGVASTNKTIDINENGTYSVVVYDRAGNVSETATFTIDNIDTIAPVVEQVTADTTTLVKDKVEVTVDVTDNKELATVTITSPSGVTTTKEVTGTEDEITFDADANGDWTIVVTDKSGNSSQTSTLTVNNIDSEVPVVEQITADTTTLVKDKVTATVDVTDNKELATVTITSPSGVTTTKEVTGTEDEITFDADANGDWTIVVTDKAGNESQTSTLTVNNIDSEAPVVEQVTADTTTPVKDKVEVTVDVTDNKELATVTITSPSGVTTTKEVTGTEDEITFDADANGDWTIVVTDKAGNSSQTSTLTVDNIDAIAPVVDSVTGDTTTAAKDPVEVTVAVSDNKELASVKITSPSGTTFTSGVAGTADEYKFNANENGTWKVTTTDKAGNVSAEKTITFANIDMVAPVIGTITKVEDPDSDSAEVTVPVTDNKELKTVTITSPSGVTTTKEVTGTADEVIFTADELGDWTVTVTDKAGNVSESKTVTVADADNIKPEIGTVTKSEDPTKDPVSVTVPVTDNKELDKVIVKDPDGNETEYPIEPGKTSSSITFDAGKNGDYEITVVDKSGNSSTAKTVTINNIDTIAPVVESLTGDTTTMTKNPVEVTAKVTDNKELATVTITSPSGVTTTQNVTGTADEIKFNADANGTWKVTTTDKAGNVSTEKTIVVNNIDTIAPVVESLTGDTTTITKNPVEVTVDVTDNKELATVTITSPSGVITTKEVTGTADEVKFNANENGTWKVTTTDKAGNVSTEKTITFANIDTIAPVVDDVIYSNSVTKDPVEVTVKVSDNKQLATATITSPSGVTTTKTVAGTADEFKFNANENGQWKVVVTDKAGNVSLEKKFNINSQDTTAPVIEKITPSTSESTGSAITATIDVTDNVELSKVSVKDPEGNVVDYPIEPGKTASSIVIDIPSNGTYQIIVEDKAGNSSTAQNLTVENIDKIAPVVEKTEFDATTVVNDKVEVTVDVTDNKELAKVEITSPSGVTTTKVVSGTSDSFKFDADENGEWKVVATDKAGNVSTEKKFAIDNIDKIAPVIETATPNTTEPTNSTITVNVDITDNVELDKVLIKDPSGNVTEIAIEPGKTSSTVTFDIPENGTYEIIVVDKSGNSSTSKEIVIDNIDVINPEVTTDIGDGVIKIVATDEGSGVDKIIVILPDGSSIEVTDSSEVEITMDGDYEIIVIDKAGNSTSKIVNAVKDNPAAPPTNDSSNVFMYLILMLVAGCGLAVSRIRKGSMN